MNKTEALSRLTSLENEAKALRAIIEAPETPKKIIERVLTFKDACDLIGEDSDDENFYDGEEDEIAFKKLKVIVRALNQGWKPNWNDSNQKKWFPWFYLNEPGFRFHVSYYSCGDSHACCGSRLAFASQELSDFAAKQFIDLYKQLIA